MTSTRLGEADPGETSIRWDQVKPEATLLLEA